MVGSWCSGALTLTYSMEELGLNDPRGRWGEEGTPARWALQRLFIFLHHVNFFQPETISDSKFAAVAQRTSIPFESKLLI